MRWKCERESLASTRASRRRIAPRATRPAAGDSHGIETMAILRRPDSRSAHIKPHLIRNSTHRGISRQAPPASDICMSCLCKKAFQLFCQLYFVFCLASPDSQNAPTPRSQLLGDLCIASDIAIELGLPKPRVGFWRCGGFAPVPMPEAPVHK